MKRLSAVILTLAIAFTLVGCGKDSREVKYAESPSATIPEKGKITGDLYESAFADLTFTKPEGWEFATDEEKASLEA